jgi:hypothetical protein
MFDSGCLRFAWLFFNPLLPPRLLFWAPLCRDERVACCNKDSSLVDKTDPISLERLLFNQNRNTVYDDGVMDFVQVHIVQKYIIISMLLKV